jgi:pimeloyl-ACP methyl ester carboxylesterase
MPFFDFRSFKLFYVDTGAPRPNAPVITFIHGFTASSNVYRNQIEYFRSNFRVVALDLLGHGESSRPLPETAGKLYHHDGFLESVIALLAHLSISQTNVVAWSMGTGAALELARQHPGKVDSLVLIGVSPLFFLPSDELTFPALPKSVSDPLLESIRTQYREVYYNFVFGWFPDYTPGDVPQKHIEDALDDAATLSSKIAHGMLSQCGPEDFRSRIPEVKTRTLIVQGGKDAMIPTDAAKWVYDNLGGKKEWLFYQDQGHAPFLGSNTDNFNADLENFLLSKT